MLLKDSNQRSVFLISAAGDAVLLGSCTFYSTLLASIINFQVVDDTSKMCGIERFKVNVAIFWDSFSKILRPNVAEKMNGEHFEKINIKTVITYIHMPNYSLFGEFQIVGENLAKRKNDENLKK